ncbi:ribosome biogenesis GTP-binding protein YsxC/EngB [Desulfocapsa sulfexigens DSM 10523]|uniref:Probable GTP-binding protein EngB n=1 Tax=Desulfocapsa sulfexigens (strain DSM 10523 / SB164P1) TaxID=1167006 RepID=M1PD56_DESSD|nr:ribosome biogenesis GTP-binding protein YihA/YsxC [Desulfocapsa sulfexigens]AGF79537.1 ribosome biogenesis GTP-binding protein YsxC/EngB [Desulfocapsa sulfexigens DSM 10523]
MKFIDIKFLLSVHKLTQLPEATLPEIAFAGRSNVGKSSLINTLVGRKSMVKVSGRPGKTQGLNFFQISEEAYLVDLPGYGFAKVSRGMQDNWQTLISSYLESRTSLCCVVVIMDLRHEAKVQDTQLISWLKQHSINYLPVYTKADKLSGNLRQKNAAILDAGHTIHSSQRILFSAKTGMGKEELERALASFAKID